MNWNWSSEGDVKGYKILPHVHNAGTEGAEIGTSTFYVLHRQHYLSERTNLIVKPKQGGGL